MLNIQLKDKINLNTFLKYEKLYKRNKDVEMAGDEFCSFS